MTIMQPASITPAVPDPPELDHILWQGFSHTTVAFDVGANCGQTLSRIKSFSDITVAFEPSVEAFSYLSERYAFDDGFRLTNLAVSGHSGMVDLVAMEGKIETGQLVTAGTPGMEWSEGSANGSVRSLPCITLDEYIKLTGLCPGFVKIDVEGHEMEVLSGAPELLNTKYRPEMLIEIHSKQLGRDVGELLFRNYDLDLVRHPHYAMGSDLWLTHFWYRCFPIG